MTKKKKQPAESAVQTRVDEFDVFDENDVLLTIRRFILRYFGPDRPKGTPTRADVVRWIRRGTVEGVQLKGRLIDGKYYVRVCDADAFFDNLRVARQEDRFSEKMRRRAHEETLRQLRELGMHV